MTDSEILQTALGYAKRGWHVFPCNPREKTPLTLHGFKDATTDAGTVRSWWSAWPTANIGLSCGPSGLLVLDVDKRHNGLESFADLRQSLGGDALDTVCCETGGGGLHLYFQRNGQELRNSAGKMGPGLDTRGVGGYVVAPPSIHPNGQVYGWALGCSPDEKPLLALPEALAVRLQSPAQTTAHPSIGAIPEGQRNVTLASLAGTMQRRGMAPATIEAALLTENQLRCNPPLDPEEVAAVVRSIARYAPAGDPEHNTELRDAPDVSALPEGENRVPAIPTPAPTSSATFRRVSITAAKLLATVFPAPVWIVAGLLPLGLGILAGRPKIGKSWLGLQLAIAVATGGRFLNYSVAQGKVVYVALEDSPRRLKNRLEQLNAPSSEELRFEFSWPAINDEGFEPLQQMIEAEHPRLVVIDTLSRVLASGSDQNDVSSMTEALAGVQALTHHSQTCILFIDHHRKNGGQDAGNAVDDVLGSTAKAAVTDTLWGLYRKRGERTATLQATGRDIDEATLSVAFDKGTCCWQLSETTGAPGSVQAQIIAYLATSEPCTIASIAVGLGKSATHISNEVSDMIGAGILEAAGRRGQAVCYQRR